jgi:DegV family protein with EDD domain
MFVLDNLETLRKNGRLTGVKAALVSVLNIKPVMEATPEGTIDQCGHGRGTKKALKKMVEEVGSRVSDYENRIFGISHCNCLERALLVKEEIEKRYPFKKIIIADTAGVGTMYANDGGVVIAF